MAMLNNQMVLIISIHQYLRHCPHQIWFHPAESWPGFFNAGLLCGSTCLRLVEPVVLLASNCNAGPAVRTGGSKLVAKWKKWRISSWMSTWQDQMFLFWSDSRHLGAETSERKLRFNLHQPECIAQRLTSIEAILILLIGAAHSCQSHSWAQQSGTADWMVSCPIPWNSTHVISKWWRWNNKLGDFTKLCKLLNDYHFSKQMKIRGILHDFTKLCSPSIIDESSPNIFWVASLPWKPMEPSKVPAVSIPSPAVPIPAGPPG